MSDTSNANQNEKVAKIRRKPERESVLTPTFAAARQTNAARSAGFHAEGGPPQVSPDDLPEDQRKALEALGYLGGADSDDD